MNAFRSHLCIQKSLYDACRVSCLELIKDGFVGAFEETLSLVVDRGTTRPRALREDCKRVDGIARMLRRAESAKRTGEVERSFRARLEFANQLEEEDDWLSKSMYESCCKVLESENLHQLQIEVFLKMAFLEERKDNVNLASAYLEKALRIAIRFGDSRREELCGNLMRVYRRQGEHYLMEEVNRKESKALLYCRKAVRLARNSNATEQSRAACHSLLGRVMMKFNDTKRALKNFQLCLELSEKNPLGKCDALLSLSEVWRERGDLEKAEQAAGECWEVAKQMSLPIPAAFAALALGQMETAKRHFTAAFHLFEKSRHLVLNSGSSHLQRLCRVMYGVGKSHLRPFLTTPDPMERNVELGKSDVVGRMVQEEFSQ